MGIFVTMSCYNSYICRVFLLCGHLHLKRNNTYNDEASLHCVQINDISIENSSKKTCHNFCIYLVSLRYGHSCDFSNQSSIKNTCHTAYINISFLQHVQVNDYLLLEYYSRTAYHSKCIGNYSF